MDGIEAKDGNVLDQNDLFSRELKRVDRPFQALREIDIVLCLRLLLRYRFSGGFLLDPLGPVCRHDDDLND
jgi:hypothetical protein